MKKIAGLFFCCCCVSFVTADLLAQIGVPCPYTKPRLRDCQTDLDCNDLSWLNMPCASRNDRVTLTGLFGSESSIHSTESVVDSQSTVPCIKTRPCEEIAGVCVSSNVPWTTSNSPPQVAVICP